MYIHFYYFFSEKYYEIILSTHKSITISPLKPTDKRDIYEEGSKNFSKILIKMLQNYGYLLGKIKLIKDNIHDEVFIEKTQLVIMENSRWLYDYWELVAIANEILGDDT